MKIGFMPGHSKSITFILIWYTLVFLTSGTDNECTDPGSKFQDDKPRTLTYRNGNAKNQPKRTRVKRGAPIPIPNRAQSQERQQTSECDNHNPSSNDQKQPHTPNSGQKLEHDLNQAEKAVDDSFDKFKNFYQKPYPNEQECVYRQHVFEQNVDKMQKLNSHTTKQNTNHRTNHPSSHQSSKQRSTKCHAPKDDAVMGINRFADTTHDEFVKFATGAQPEAGVPFGLNRTELDKATSNLAQHIDWRNKNVIGKIRDQGSCGSCYAFCSADLISTQNAVERQESAKTLSAQYVMDCDAPGRGCNGARVGKVLDKLISETNGVLLEQCYEYQGKLGICSKDKTCCIHQKIKSFQILDISNAQEKELMAALLQWGPLIIVIEASDAWQFYNGTGIIKEHQCPSGRQNHAVMIVGYNFDPQQTATPYYVIKNSWGADWGSNGYAKLEAGTNACQVAKAVFTACAIDERFKDAKTKLLSGLSPFKS